MAEGQVRGPWLDELRQSCEQWLAKGSALHLDLSDVSFIDMDGVALCRRLRDRTVHFALDIWRVQLYKGGSHCSGRLVRHHADSD
jgi:hypothetical protein